LIPFDPGPGQETVLPQSQDERLAAAS
jgi:hypothetical protein